MSISGKRQDWGCKTCSDRLTSEPQPENFSRFFTNWRENKEPANVMIGQMPRWHVDTFR